LKEKGQYANGERGKRDRTDLHATADNVERNVVLLAPLEALLEPAVKANLGDQVLANFLKSVAVLPDTLEHLSEGVAEGSTVEDLCE
jgi:hypothetical protein